MIIDDLVQPLTVAEAKKSIYDSLAILGVATTTWKAGAVVRTIIVAMAIMIAALSRLVAMVARSGFLSTADGEWHKELSKEVYGVETPPATFASTIWLASNSGGGNYPLASGDLVVKSSITQKEYYNTEVTVIGPLAVNVPISIAAFEAGSGSSAGPGEIDELVTNLTGVTGSNTQPAVGYDEFTVEERTRLCKAKTVAVSPNGAREAYEYVALTATREDGTLIGVTRCTPVGDTLGNVSVYIATASGAVAPADVTLVEEQIQRLATPLGITSATVSATPVSVPITYEIWARNTGGIAEADVTAAVEESLVRFFANEPIGGRLVGVSRKLYRSAIITAIGAADTANGQSLAIFRADLAIPAADVVLAASEVPTLGTITATVHLV